MHIPDSVISPSTAIVCDIVMLPVWAIAARATHTRLKSKQIPLLAMGAAFSFTVMMFNIPALGGTTAHAVGGTLLAVLLGPAAAIIGMSVTLAVQALLFGDGGIMALGVNCLTMAVALPCVGYYAYKLVMWAARNHHAAPLAAGIGAYIGINFAAFLVALILGMQPVLFHEADGRAIYFPFGLAITLPGMLGTHLLIAGPLEGMVTGVAIRYCHSIGIHIHDIGHIHSPRTPRVRWAVIPLLLLIVPIGLLAKGEAWGEWDVAGVRAQIERKLGVSYVPKGIEKAEAHSYSGMGALQGYGVERGAKGYYLAAAVGVIVTLLTLLGLGKALGKVEASVQPGGDRSSLHAHDESTTLPSWMLQQESIIPAPAGKRENPFLARSLKEVTGKLRHDMIREPLSNRDGLLQSLNPRSRLVGLVGLAILSASLRSPILLASLLALSVVIWQASKLPIDLLIKRVWIPLPTAIGLLFLPAALNVITPGKVFLTLWMHPHIAFTTGGLALVGMIVLRTMVTLTFAAALGFSSRASELLASLRKLAVPSLFVTVLTMTYRFLITLLQSAQELFEARQSRSSGYTTHSEGRLFSGRSIGALFGRTFYLADEVQQAMISRGFLGEIKATHVRSLARIDGLWLVGCLFVAIAFIYSTRKLG